MNMHQMLISKMNKFAFPTVRYTNHENTEFRLCCSMKMVKFRSKNLLNDMSLIVLDESSYCWINNNTWHCFTFHKTTMNQSCL